MSKRIFDIFFALIGIIVFFPLYLLISIWVKFDSSGDVFFRQKRVGKNGVEFKVLKFRTMQMNAESMGMKITVGNDKRITTAGHFIRKYKLDELPQIINVLCGDMSFVGPRPEVKEYIDEYPEVIKKEVLSVKPGITDNASIFFRDENFILANSSDPKKTYIEEILPIKQKYYLEYIRNNTIFGDVKLIVKTILKIVR